VIEFVVDTSVIGAILLREPERETFHLFMLANQPIMSTATLVEVGNFARRRLGERGIGVARTALINYHVTYVPLDEHQAQIALVAMDRYGKGRAAPPAVLNYGDLFSYALAKAQDLPLLFKGNDFSATDITPALS
jgi:ribonuclease VapC